MVSKQNLPHRLRRGLQNVHGEISHQKNCLVAAPMRLRKTNGCPEPCVGIGIAYFPSDDLGVNCIFLTDEHSTPERIHITNVRFLTGFGQGLK